MFNHPQKEFRQLLYTGVEPLALALLAPRSTDLATRDSPRVGIEPTIFGLDSPSRTRTFPQFYQTLELSK